MNPNPWIHWLWDHPWIVPVLYWSPFVLVPIGIWSLVNAVRHR